MTTFHNWLSQIIDEPTKPIEPIETHDQQPNHKMGSTAETTAITFNAIKGGQGVQNPLRWTQDVITPHPSVLLICTLNQFHNTHEQKVKIILGKMKSKPVDSCIKEFSARRSKRVSCRTKNPHASILVHIFCS